MASRPNLARAAAFLLFDMNLSKVEIVYTVENSVRQKNRVRFISKKICARFRACPDVVGVSKGSGPYVVNTLRAQMFVRNSQPISHGTLTY